MAPQRYQMIVKKYQITLINPEGRYKPVSAIVDYKQEEDVNLLTSSVRKKDIVSKGIIKICHKRGWTQKELKEYGYTSQKSRVYDPQAIIAEKEEKKKADFRAELIRAMNKG